MKYHHELIKNPDTGEDEIKITMNKSGRTFIICRVGKWIFCLSEGSDLREQHLTLQEIERDGGIDKLFKLK